MADYGDRGYLFFKDRSIIKEFHKLESVEITEKILKMGEDYIQLVNLVKFLIS